MEPFESIDEFLVKIDKCPRCNSLFSYSMDNVGLYNKSKWKANINCKCNYYNQRS